MAIFGKKINESAKSELSLDVEFSPAEKVASPEQKRESLPDREQPAERTGQSGETEELNAKPALATGPQVPSMLSAKRESLHRIENVLEEGLSEAYGGMDSQHQQMFKRAGEETARQIEVLLGEAKIKVQKIFELIKAWLTMIPGINKWFVVQESKIKTDKLLRLNK